MPLRPATPADLPHLFSFDHLARTPARRSLLDRSCSSHELHISTLPDSDVPVAYAILTHTFFDHAFVPLLYVHPAHRRRGLATALLLRLEPLALTPKLFTSTNQSNTPMRTLLARLSYEPSGTILNLDPDDPELIFVKPLPPRTTPPPGTPFAQSQFSPACESPTRHQTYNSGREVTDMPAKVTPTKWIIVLVAHDDPDLEPQVLKEQIPVTDDEHFAALLRGGHLIATLPDDPTEPEAESLRREIEKQCLR